MPKDLYSLLKREIKLIERLEFADFELNVKDDDSEENQLEYRKCESKLKRCRLDIIKEMEKELSKRRKFRKKKL